MRSFPILLAVALLLGLSSPVRAADVAFPDWLAALKAEAIGNGIDPTIASQALDSVQPIDRVLELDRKQPEFTMTWDEYLAHTASPQRVEDGKKQLAQNRAALKRLSAKYGVPPQQMVAR